MPLFPTRAAYRKAPLQDFAAAITGASTTAAPLILGTLGDVRESRNTAERAKGAGRHDGNINRLLPMRFGPLRLSTPFADQLLGCRITLWSAGRFQARHDTQWLACARVVNEFLHPAGGGRISRPSCCFLAILLDRK